MINFVEVFIVQSRLDGSEPWLDAHEFFDLGEALDWADYMRDDGDTHARVVRRWREGWDGDTHARVVRRWR